MSGRQSTPEPAARPDQMVVIPSTRKAQPKADAGPAKSTNKVIDARVRLHRMLIEEINLVALERLPQDEMRRQVHDFVSKRPARSAWRSTSPNSTRWSTTSSTRWSASARSSRCSRIPTITDILINGHQNCFVERDGQAAAGRTCRSRTRRICCASSTRSSPPSAAASTRSQPMVDARLLDGSRFNAAIRPVGVDGPLVSIRKFSKNKLDLHKLVEFGALTPAHGRGAGRRRACAQDDDHLGRHRHRQDDDAERAVGLHPRGRAPDHHRGRRRTAAAAAACRPHGDAAGQHRGPGRDSSSATWSRTRCACVPTASSSASAAAKRPSTCCRP